MITMKNSEPIGMIDIPQFNSWDQFETNREKADKNNKDHCPCCGKQIDNPKYFINTIYGGLMYPAIDKNVYPDAWVMGVGSECRKKLPKEYVFNVE